MSWAAIMGLDELLAKLQREAGTPGTPEYTGGVPVKALPLLGCTLGTPGTPQNNNDGEKAEPGHSRQAETGKSLTRPYLAGGSGVPRVKASIGKAFTGTPPVCSGVPGVSARGELPTLAAEPIERTGDDPDDRRRCDQCGNLRGAVCIIAKPGGLVSAIVGYRPALPEMLQRCAGFSPRTLA
ncbi:MAG: hypothetical protein V5B39_04740 [Accumulibacter sp.]|jgi:hypothetical protein|uniref:hypothetical protein n=1 Tax=Accumulibacter sp. TaxID=2053492 RepID=UPI002FC39A3F